MSEHLPARVTTPLLTLITQQSLDEDYALVARRREERGESVASRRDAPAHRVAALAGAAIGLLVATAAVQTAQDSDETQASRTELVQRVMDRRDTVTALQDSILRLRDKVARRDRRLSAVTASVVTEQSRVRRLEVSTGYLAVSGPGVKITVTDGPGPDDEVRSSELRPLVNGLWEAGAEAISINGQRLTTLTSIVNSGEVIRVNQQAISTPYVVSAIGDRRTLQANLLESQGGQSFATAVSAFGFGFEMSDAERLALPEAARTPLRHASALVADDSGGHQIDPAQEDAP
ncbi:DUF881 domain-containing protein [Nocardioides acrostichi]|uniref:DUF881 domain-containing protein n=1 Tax=Nocardioides acrostichi TaxID=2784339 RepID=A0A930Y943_9ACTN|nr:DUF881 domain-containing protein [Nocardioides acrostichi]MBF4163777.1 DUF881 domain-containing protein [Nocardioides acrostichi]